MESILKKLTSLLQLATPVFLLMIVCFFVYEGSLLINTIEKNVARIHVKIESNLNKPAPTGNEKSELPKPDTTKNKSASTPSKKPEPLKLDTTNKTNPTPTGNEKPEAPKPDTTKNKPNTSSGQPVNFTELSSILTALKEVDSVLTTAYSTSLNYFLVGGVILILLVLLPRIESISGGGFSVTLKKLEELENEVKEVKANANKQQAASALQIDKGKGALSDKSPGSKSYGFPISLNRSAVNNFETESVKPDDPQKGQWGSQTERNGRRLSAAVRQIVGNKDYFEVILKVESTDAANPLTGAVKFHLHPTFFNSNPIIFVQDGKAELKLIAWGAFTAGAEADNGNTQLELDLADKKWGFPEEFRNR